MHRVLRLTLRFLVITWIIGLSFGRYAWRRLLAGFIDRPTRETLRGRVLADTLERLGATFIKFGQILSTRPDLLGPGYVQALSRLQDQVPPGPFEEVEALLREELGPERRARITHIEQVPVAAASVAQVHRARLDTGESVALKVQRPSAPAQIDRDLVLMSLGTRLLSLLPSLKLLSLPGAVARFSIAMHGQLDFRLEAENNRRFAENLSTVEGVEVPRLYDELCTRRVLVMEFVDGVRANEPEKVGRRRSMLARKGADAILRMVFRDGFVHADLHPGNILLTDEDHVVLIDLGLVAEIPKDMLRPWCETFMALAQRDGPRLARMFYAYAPFAATEDYEAYERDVVDFFAQLHDKNLGDIEVGVIVTGAMAILRRHRVQIDPVFTVVKIALVVAEGLGKQLDPELDMIQLSAPYLMEAMASAPPGKEPRREPPAPVRKGARPDVGLLSGAP